MERGAADAENLSVPGGSVAEAPGWVQMWVQTWEAAGLQRPA